MHLDSRLLIFSKYPVPGEAKTRLIPALGPEGAAQLHRRMTESVVNIARSTYEASPENRDRVTVHYTGAQLRDFRAWLGPDLQYKAQPSGNLGQRMQNAFQTTLEHAADHSIAAIGFGTDVPDLSSAILQQAHASLGNHDIVLGPAADGGYYLIGLKSFYPELFADIDWGTERVYGQTREIATHLGLRIAELPMLSDIDRPEDLSTLTGDPRFCDIIEKGRKL
ncbi:MAG: TIGR04282 family arsenosugar biosynthesis glycosyltransferase [Desulfuromusa sp.]|jgi:rSAM/selenodomain-associated transferase 1|nr:TIGR04282 family arsenosugar biosynthesis glycosyltransferase [Desulfuromusa sp.]